MSGITAKVVGGLSTESLLKKLAPKIKNVRAVVYNEVTRYADPFTPFAEGDLLSSLRPIIKNGEYHGWEYTVPYAKKPYFGVDFNFSKDVHPLARPFWVREAYEVYKQQIIKKAQEVL